MQCEQRFLNRRLQTSSRQRRVGKARARCCRGALFFGQEGPHTERRGRNEQQHAGDEDGGDRGRERSVGELSRQPRHEGEAAGDTDSDLYAFTEIDRRGGFALRIPSAGSSAFCQIAAAERSLIDPMRSMIRE
jgi:hypothetical protein